MRPVKKAGEKRKDATSGVDGVGSGSGGFRSDTGSEAGSKGSVEYYEAVFPSREAAAGSPRVVVRHARDPELQERWLVHRLNKSLERTATLHAIGAPGWVGGRTSSS